MNNIHYEVGMKPEISRDAVALLRPYPKSRRDTYVLK